MASLYNSNNLIYNPPFNIILNPNGNSGEMFIVTPDEACTLDISFDYLFKFDCADLLAYLNTNPTNANILNLIESIGATLDLNIVNSGTLVTYTPVYKEQFFKPIGSGNTFNYITTLSGASSGLYLCGEVPNDTTCYPVTNSNLPLSNCSTALSAIFNILKSQSGISALTSNYDEIILSGLSSTWANYNAEITDQTVISAITNQNINISITVSGTSINTYVLLDNIEINRNCTHISRNDIFVSQSPGFELKKIIDNKKSWVLNTSPEERKYSVSNLNNLVSKRQTDYELDNGLQVLNTKEIDLNLDIAKAVETDVWNYILNNPLILTGTTVGTTTIEMGDCNPHVICVSDSCGDAPIDINGLMTQSLSAVTTVENFENYIESELVDAKNRKIISSYPTLRLLYDRYMNALNYSGKQSNQFDYIAMINFAKLIGNYWVDIIEQVMPSTAIWASSKVYGNHLFDSQKFKYRNSTLLFGTATTVNSVLSPCSGITCNADITTKVIVSGSSNVSQFLNQQSNDSFNSAYIIQFNSGSEFIGKVTSTANFVCNIELSLSVLNNAYPNNTGGIITSSLLGSNGNITYTLSATSSNSIISEGGLVSNLPLFNNLSADTYLLTVIDSNGCTSSESITVNLNPCDLVFSSSKTNSYPNMNNGVISINSVNDSYDNQPEYSLSGNTTLLSAGTYNNSPIVFVNLSAGTYSLKVTDKYGCSITSGITITDNICILNFSAMSDVNSQFDNGNGNGSITLVLNNSYGTSTYILSGATQTITGNLTSGSTTISNLVGGVYNIEFIDNKAVGCYSSTTVTINVITYSGYTGYCETISDFVERSQLSGLSNPNNCGVVSDKLYITYYSNPYGNISYFNTPETISAQTIANISYITSYNKTYYTSLIDIDNEKIYFVGQNTTGLDVYDIILNSTYTLPYGSNTAYDRQILYSIGSGSNKLIVVNDSVNNGYRIYQANLIKNGYAGQIITYKNNLSYKNYFSTSGTTFNLGTFIQVGNNFWTNAGNGVSNGNILIFNVDINGNIVSNNGVTLPNITPYRNAFYQSSSIYDSTYGVVYFFDWGSAQLFVIGSDGIIKNTRNLNRYKDGDFLLVGGFSFDPVDTSILYLNLQHTDVTDKITPRHYSSYVINRGAMDGTLTRYYKDFNTSSIQKVNDGLDNSVMSVNGSNGTLTVYNNSYSGYTTGNYIYTTMLKYINGVAQNPAITGNLIQGNTYTDIYGKVFSAPKEFSGACSSYSYNQPIVSSTYSASTPNYMVNYNIQFDPTVYNNPNITGYRISVYDNANSVQYSTTGVISLSSKLPEYFEGSLTGSGTENLYKLHIDYYSGGTLTLATSWDNLQVPTYI